MSLYFHAFLHCYTTENILCASPHINISILSYFCALSIALGKNMEKTPRPGLYRGIIGATEAEILGPIRNPGVACGV